MEAGGRFCDLREHWNQDPHPLILTRPLLVLPGATIRMTTWIRVKDTSVADRSKVEPHSMEQPALELSPWVIAAFPKAGSGIPQIRIEQAECLFLPRVLSPHPHLRLLSLDHQGSNNNSSRNHNRNIVLRPFPLRRPLSRTLPRNRVNRISI